MSDTVKEKEKKLVIELSEVAQMSKEPPTPGEASIWLADYLRVGTTNDFAVKYMFEEKDSSGKNKFIWLKKEGKSEVDPAKIVTFFHSRMKRVTKAVLKE